MLRPSPCGLLPANSPVRDISAFPGWWEPFILGFVGQSPIWGCRWGSPERQRRAPGRAEHPADRAGMTDAFSSAASHVTKR